jgi:hypothetical protein
MMGSRESRDSGGIKKSNAKGIRPVFWASVSAPSSWTRARESCAALSHDPTARSAELFGFAP